MNAWGAGLVVVLVVAGCSTGAPSYPTNSREFDASSAVTSPQLTSQAPVAVTAPIGTRVEVPVSTTMTDGSVVTGRAAFTVSNLHPITPAISIPGSDTPGTYYAVDVTVEALAGTIVVHPFNFSFRTEDGTNLDPELSAVTNGLPATDLPQGQKVAGQIAAKVPPGKAVAEILAFSQIGGTQLGRWTA